MSRQLTKAETQLATEREKKCSTSPGMREMPTKTPQRRWADENFVGEGCSSHYPESSASAPPDRSKASCQRPEPSLIAASSQMWKREEYINHEDQIHKIWTVGNSTGQMTWLLPQLSSMDKGGTLINQERFNKHVDKAQCAAVFTD